MTAELENALILIADTKVSNIRDLLPILEKVSTTKSPLLIIVKDIETEALATLVVNHMRGIVKVAVVHSPHMGELQKETLKDIAVLTGADIISGDVAKTLDVAELQDLGLAKRVVVGKHDTTIIGGAGNADDIKLRVKQIETELKETTGSRRKEMLQNRIAKLDGGVAVIKIGATTEVEMKEKKDRVEDALHATTAAIEEGIVPGGGTALIRAQKSLADLKGDNQDQTVGIDILRKAIAFPIKQIAQNAGYEPSVVIDRVSILKGNFGFDAATGEYCDLIKAGILDPTKVTRTAVQNAASIAGLMLTTECMIAEFKEEDNEQQE